MFSRIVEITIQGIWRRKSERGERRERRKKRREGERVRREKRR
jgi:hypothetical protein